MPCNVHNSPRISVDLECNSIITDKYVFVKRNMDLTAERLLQIMSKEKKMKKNRMGNLLSIAGDDAEDIKQFIDSFLSQDSESDDPEEKCVDFCKIIAVADSEDEEECLREWGVKQNASNTSVIYEGEGQPPAIAHLIFFDSEEVVPAIVRALANKRPDLYFRYEFCDEEAQYAGELIIEGGYEHGELYEPRGEDAIVLFHEIWGRYDAFVKDEKTGRYIPADETERQLEME